jgi:hypothetical protein
MLRDFQRVRSGLSFLKRAQEFWLRVKTGRHVVEANLGPSETPAKFAWRVSNLLFQHSSPRFSNETDFDYIPYKTVTLVPLQLMQQYGRMHVTPRNSMRSSTSHTRERLASAWFARLQFDSCIPRYRICDSPYTINTKHVLFSALSGEICSWPRCGEVYIAVSFWSCLSTIVFACCARL